MWDNFQSYQLLWKIWKSYCLSVVYGSDLFDLKCRGYSKGRIEADECWRFDHLSCEKPLTGTLLHLHISAELSINAQSATSHIKPVLFYVYAEIPTCQVFAREKRR
jgi:hypothetical protein